MISDRVVFSSSPSSDSLNYLVSGLLCPERIMKTPGGTKISCVEESNAKLRDFSFPGREKQIIEMVKQDTVTLWLVFFFFSQSCLDDRQWLSVNSGRKMQPFETCTFWWWQMETLQFRPPLVPVLCTFCQTILTLQVGYIMFHVHKSKRSDSNSQHLVLTDFAGHFDCFCLQYSRNGCVHGLTKGVAWRMDIQTHLMCRWAKDQGEDIGWLQITVSSCHFLCLRIRIAVFFHPEPAGSK